MPFPLIAVAIGAGVVRGAYGAYVNHKNSAYNKSAIRRAYGVASDSMRTDQADARQNINESLNSRGILTSGGVGSPSQSKVRQALGAGGDSHILPAGTGPWYAPNGVVGKQDEQIGYYNDASGNSLGGSNTLSGQINRDTSDEMYKEKKNLRQGELDALHANSAAATQGYLDSVSAGINTAATIYGIGKSFQGTPGATPQIPTPQVGVTDPGPYNPGAIPTIKGAYSIPANPVFSHPSASGTSVAMPSQANSTFNVSRRGPNP